MRPKSLPIRRSSGELVLRQGVKPCNQRLSVVCVLGLLTEREIGAQTKNQTWIFSLPKKCSVTELFGRIWIVEPPSKAPCWVTRLTYGAPGEIRTPNPAGRSRMLCPVELQGQMMAASERIELS